MRIGIIGATGFVGSRTAELAAEAGHEVVGYSRSQQESTESIVEWRSSKEEWDLSELDVLINFSGHSVDRRWTQKNKSLFFDSRVGVVKGLVEAMRSMPKPERPKVFLSSSAVGIYGDGRDVILNEDGPEGEGYLADLCRDWEDAAKPAEDLGVRVAMMRIGFVIGKGGAAYEKLLKVFRCGLGGRLGNGQQWMPWIHIDDLARAYIFAAESSSVRGAVNLSAPEPERNRDFTGKLARFLRRPAIFAVPGFALKFVMGGFGDVLLKGQRTTPQVLLNEGFEFDYPLLEQALEELVD